MAAGTPRANAWSVLRGWRPLERADGVIVARRIGTCPDGLATDEGGTFQALLVTPISSGLGGGQSVIDVQLQAHVTKTPGSEIPLSSSRVPIFP